ncbi:MAG: hypothetical protein KAU06_06050 [Candidatus Marinimicrobia bacterium]|nr:hypothetical protein [Candidatus Neomarinimicrobiota bacterium]
MMKINIKKIVTNFVTVFALTLVVAAITTFLYSLIVHGAGTIDWKISFRFAIIFGIILTWIAVREKKENREGKN